VVQQGITCNNSCPVEKKNKKEQIVAERVWYRSTPKHRLIDVKSVLFSGINNDRRASEAGILVGCISKCIVTCFRAGTNWQKF